MKDPFETWLMGTGLSSKTAREYFLALRNNVSQWAKEAGIIECNLLDIHQQVQLVPILSKLSNLSIFEEKNRSSRGRFSAALSKYGEYCEHNSVSPLERDLAEIEEDVVIDKTEKRQLVNARLGQGAFRVGVFSIWKKCAVTGVGNPELLIASHIKPWAKSDNFERLNPYNGLLLTPNLDRAFDKGLISFTSDGSLVISRLFSDSGLLGIDSRMRIALERRHLPFLEFHHGVVFRRS